MKEKRRERLGSRLGFILLSAGCAIGVGNVWKFPYMVGQNGGGAFVLLYILFLVLMGVPVLTMEFSLGRAAQKSMVTFYKRLEAPGEKWHIHGYVSLAGNYLLMMFYTTVSGWILSYFIKTARGAFENADPAAVTAAFGQMTANPWELILFMAITVILGFFICSFSLQGGLERITKYMMIALLVIMVGLAGYGFTMQGAAEGLSFYLKPDFTKLTPGVAVAAMNQAFFTLSIGMGNMAIFGSYIGKDRALMGESVSVICLDTFVALVAGLIIFPACFTYNGGHTDAGPSLIFETLPNIFNSMRFGRLFGSLFFIFMMFAAFSTVLGVFENIVSCTCELTHWHRKKAAAVNCLAMFVLSLPCALGFNVLSGVHPLGASTTIKDLEDFLVSNCILPLGSLVYVLFCTWSKSFGWKKFTHEANIGEGMKTPNWLYPYCKFVLPVLIFALFVIGIVDFFR